MAVEKDNALKDLKTIPGVGISFATDLWNIGITSVMDLNGKNPEALYALSNQYAGVTQDRCVLYVFRCAVYYATTAPQDQIAEKLKWWNWKN